MFYQIDDLKLDTGRRELTRDGKAIKLTKLSFKVLEVLAQSAPDLVSYDEMIDRVWGENRVVSPENLSQRVMMLRQSLGDDASEPRYIEAVRGQGLRLVAQVTHFTHSNGTSISTASSSENSSVNTSSVGASATGDAGISPLKAWLAGLVACALMLLAVTLWYNNTTGYSRQATTSTERKSNSVAVLPFSNLSPDANNSFFAAGIHEEVLNQLANITGLRVISRTSMLRFENTQESIPKIAKQLNVDSLVEGSVRYANDRIRVTVQLVDGDSDEHHWSQTYDRELKDIFQVETEIARDVAAALHQVIDADSSSAHRAAPTNNLHAYQEYMQGRQALIHRREAGLKKAVQHFSLATELDPEFALAWVGKADAMGLLSAYSEIPPEDNFPQRQTAIDNALDIAPGLAEAWLALAYLERQRGHADEAEKYYLRSIELNPKNVQAQHWYGHFLLHDRGRPEQAMPYLRRAVSLDPLGPAPVGALSQALWALGRVEEALANRQTLLSSPEALQLSAPGYSGWLAQLGRLDEAMYWAKTAADAESPSWSARITECDASLWLGDDQALESCQSAVLRDFPHMPELKSWGKNYIYRQDYAQYLKDMQRQHASEFEQKAPFELGFAYLLNSRVVEAQAVFIEIIPQYFGDDDIEIEVWEIRGALVAATTMLLNNNPERANEIFDQVLEKTKSMHRIRGWGFGMADIVVHVARDDRAKAKAALREAIDVGWRQQWWQLNGPLYARIQEDPEWQALYAELEADVARQRDNYYAHKDNPDYWRAKF